MSDKFENENLQLSENKKPVLSPKPKEDPSKKTKILLRNYFISLAVMLIIGSIAVALAAKSLCPGVLFYPVGIVYVVYIGFTIYTDIVFIKNHNPIFPFLAVFPSWITFWMAIVAWSNSIIPDNVIFMNMDYVLFGALLLVNVLGAVPMIVLLFIATGIPALASDLHKRNKSSKK